MKKEDKIIRINLTAIKYMCIDIFPLLFMLVFGGGVAVVTFALVDYNIDKMFWVQIPTEIISYEKVGSDDENTLYLVQAKTHPAFFLSFFEGPTQKSYYLKIQGSKGNYWWFDENKNWINERIIRLTLRDLWIDNEDRIHLETMIKNGSNYQIPTPE